ncbi:MAG: NYN domain-containing protein [Peptococcaceae bacterium]|jgi:predicted RNA-binding protein with PIN domain|nr:NYN domain-containing protein [Peptococcaceae bacterium]MDH7526116.1 NYN domain-containing protein [Peptococcaceae bacterium]
MDGKEDYLVIDGYNMINAWPELNRIKEESFEDARQKLIEILENYQGIKKIRIIIVFDAHQVKGGLERKETHHSVEVIFTREGETADMLIERMVGELSRRGYTFVATSDWIEQSISLQRGALRISARELYEDIKNTVSGAMELARDERKGLGSLHYHLPVEVKEKLEKWRRGKT